VKELAAELGLTVVPTLFPVGYSNSLLWHDPNLAEGLPVKDALFVVQGGQARLQADPPIAFPETPTLVDRSVTVGGGVATVQGNSGNARFMYRLGVPRFRSYHVSVKVRTADYTARPQVKVVVGGDRQLQFTRLGAARSQDWTEHHVVFNTLDNDRVEVYFGVWDAAQGTLQWRDWKIEEAGLVNVLRRPGAPLTVRHDDRALVEGVDLDPVSDPRMLTTEIRGDFEVWHDAPAIRTRGLPDGARLRVSWSHPHVVYDEQVMCCVSEPRVNELLADQARRARDVWNSPGYMMSHDEVRVLNQDASCRARNMTPGQLLADNVRYCTRLLDGTQAYAWNDMFDPFHNAVKGPYYLVNGDLTGSWEGLDPGVTVMNWNFDNRDKSLKFFAARGHKQVIAGYYDDDVDRVNDWLASAARVRGVVGVMYTTWEDNYDDLEAFSRRVHKFRGR
jgi:hypothetical protein